MKVLSVIALIFVIVGAVNWGLVGLFQYDLVAAMLGGSNAGFARFTYCLVGLAGVLLAAFAVYRTELLEQLGVDVH